MGSYHANQATSMELFSGHYRQRGSGFGALASGIGRVARPLARRFLLPAVKLIGKELLRQSVPELLGVISWKRSPKQSLKNTVSKVSKTVKKHTGGSRKRTLRQRRLRSRSKSSSKRTSAVKKNGKTSFPLGGPWKDVGPIFSPKLKMIANLLPTEATHSSLDFFEKPALLVTFDGCFWQKLGPIYSPSGPM